MNSDVIIIGSGPGAAYLAAKFVAEGKKTTVLEKGMSHPFTESSLSQLPMLNLIFTHRINSIIRGITTGGSSMLYFGSVISPPKDMFARYQIDLTEAERIIRTEVPNQPLPDHLLSEAAKHLIEAANNIGYNWKPLDKFIDQSLLKPGYQPQTARWNARGLLSQAVNNGGILITGAAVEKILYTGGKVTGVQYRHNGMLQKLSSTIVICAAGGISSASLFQQSRLRISKGFFCDPLVAVMAVSKTFRQSFQPLPMLSGELDAEQGIMLTDMPLPMPVFSSFALKAMRPDLLLKYAQTLIIMVKIRDELAGEISSHDRVQRKLTRNDQHLINIGTERAKQILYAADARQPVVSSVTSAHPGGSLRIGDILNHNLETEIKGLYVCDASVIPEPWGLPPTLTILCLANRLSHHLSN